MSVIELRSIEDVAERLIKLSRMDLAMGIEDLTFTVETDRYNAAVRRLIPDYDPDCHGYWRIGLEVQKATGYCAKKFNDLTLAARLEVIEAAAEMKQESRAAMANAVREALVEAHENR